MDILEKLKQLRKEHNHVIPFKSLIEFEKWADEVYPLLKYSDILSQQFKRARHHVAIDLPSGPTERTVENINHAVDIVNQAIQELENQPHSFFSRQGKLRTRWRARFKEHPIRYSLVVGLIFFILGIIITLLIFQKTAWASSLTSDKILHESV